MSEFKDDVYRQLKEIRSQLDYLKVCIRNEHDGRLENYRIQQNDHKNLRRRLFVLEQTIESLKQALTK